MSAISVNPGVRVHEGRALVGHQRWRLTKRGVLVAVVALMVVASWVLGEVAGGLGVGVGVGPTSTARSQASAVALVADEARHIVVRPGETLWSIAAREYPDTDPRAVVVALRRANPGLGELWAGMGLRLPDAV